MPVDEGTRGTQPALKPKPQPHPVLQERFNFHGSVEEFNRRLEVIDKSHRDTVGYRPTGALAYDIAKSPVKDDQVPVLFQVPRTKKAAVAAGFVRKSATGILEKTDPVSGLVSRSAEFAPEPLTEDELLDGLAAAARVGQKAFRAFHSEHRADIERFSSNYGFGQSPFALRNAPPEVRAASIGPLNNVDKAFGIAMLGTSQIVTGLALGVPVLAYAEGKATYESVQQRSYKPLLRTNKGLAVEAGKSLWADAKAVATLDWDYMAENPGNIAMDLFAAGSLGAGGVSRVSRGSLRAKPPGRNKVTLGDVTREVPASPNPLVRPIERFVLARRQRAAELRAQGDPRGNVVPESIATTVAGRFLRRNYSFERKMGRLRERERRIELAVQLGLVRDLERVAGWSVAQSNVAKILPKEAKHGLTVGENMALLIESLDVVGTPITRAAALRDHHERMLTYGPKPFAPILGDIDPATWGAEHTVRLNAIALAEKVLDDPSKQSARFQTALEKVREASETQTLLRINELGLSPVTAKGRVGKLGALVEGDITKADGQKRPEAFYVPSKAREQTRRQPKDKFRAKREGPYGTPPFDLNRLVPELTHEFKGNHFLAGNYRFDVASLLAESLGQTIRATMQKKDWDEQWDMALPKPPLADRDMYGPIRDIADAPVWLKSLLAKVDTGEFTQRDADAVGVDAAEQMHRFLYPGKFNRKTGEWEGIPDDAHVRWVDRRAMPVEAYTQPLPGWVSGPLHLMNAPLVMLRVFLRPFYAVNIASNAVIAALTTSYTIPNVGRALRARTLYGDKIADGFEGLVGQGRSKSYTIEGESKLSKSTRVVGKTWSRITDRDLRVAAMIAHSRKLGYGDHKDPVKDAADFDRLLFSDDPKVKADRNEARQRAVEDMVELDNMTWVEKNVLKQALFVYPWTSRSTVWSLRTMIDHPVKADILVHIGQSVEDDDNFLKYAPDWMKRSGWVPYTTDENGKPIAGSWASVNPFGGLGDIVHGDLEEFIGPAMEIGRGVVTGRDKFGREYPGGEVMQRVRAVVDVYANIPVVQAYVRGEKHDDPLPVVDVTDRSTLIRQLNAAGRQAILSPGYWHGFGVLFSGGTTPRTLNTLAMKSRWYKELPLEKKFGVELGLMRTVLNMQGDLLGDPVPMAVKEAVDLRARLDLTARKWEADNEGATLGPRQRATMEIAQYKKEGLIDAAEEAEIVKNMKSARTGEDYDGVRRKMFVDYGGGNALRDWDSDVSDAAEIINSKLLEADLAQLRKQGLTGASAKGLKEDQLVGYAQKVIRHKRETLRREDAIDEIDGENEKTVARAALRAWQDATDKDVSVGGRMMPSLTRLAWAKTWDEDERAQEIAGYATRDWADLSGFEKELLGRKLDPKVGSGWAELEQIVTEQKDGGTRTIPDTHMVNLAKYVNADHPGFFQDFLFSRQPLFRRLENFRPIQQSPNAAKWRQLFADARIYEARRKEKAVKDLWKSYVNDTLTAEVNADPSFQKELSLYGDNVLEGLIN